MTVIVANRELMASDSRVTAEDGFFYTAPKIFVAKDGSIVGAAGDAGDCSRFVEWAVGGFRAAKPKFGEDAVEAIVLRKDGLYYFQPDYPAPERINDPYIAIGIGGQAGMIAMKHLSDPVAAVEEVFSVNHLCGPPVQVLRLSDKGA